MALYNPNSFPTGCRVITINSVTYKSNSETITEPGQETLLYDEAGAPMGHFIQTDFYQGTWELQLATTGTALPTTAARSATTGVFTLDGDTWSITSVTLPREKLGQRVVSIVARKNVA